jgi:hypothetical protein
MSSVEQHLVISQISSGRTDKRNSPGRFREILWAVRSHKGAGEIQWSIPERLKAQEGQSH